MVKTKLQTNKSPKGTTRIPETLASPAMLLTITTLLLKERKESSWTPDKPLDDVENLKIILNAVIQEFKKVKVELNRLKEINSINDDSDSSIEFINASRPTGQD